MTENFFNQWNNSNIFKIYQFTNNEFKCKIVDYVTDMKHFGKYLRKSYNKYKKKYTEEYGDKVDADILENMIQDRLNDELKSGIQTMQYQINTLMTTNGQSPFVTLFLHLDEDDEYIEENARIINEILSQRLQGIKNETGVYVTPAFPKLVYVLDKCNNLTGGKYDYITELAVQCSAKRMYPDYISAKKMRENYEGNVFSPMGCRSFLSPWKDADGNYYGLDHTMEYGIYTNNKLRGTFTFDDIYKDIDLFISTTITAVEEIDVNKDVANVRYYNMAGQEMPQANGVTIVVTTYTDGSTTTAKVIK